MKRDDDNARINTDSLVSGEGDVNLLVGLMALRAGFLTPERLLVAARQWLREKNGSLGDALVAGGILAADDLALVNALVERSLHRHDGQVGESIASLGAPKDLLANLVSLPDSSVAATLTLATPGGEATSGGDSHERYAGQRYKVLRPHAHGGLGKISVALDQELGREVALKELRDRYANDADYQARFLVEAEITGGLEHPGVVPVYGLGQYADGRPFYAMRFVRGDSLMAAIRRYHDRLQADPKDASLDLEFRQLLGRFIDVCQAMHYAHHRGVLHRDLKPANVMLGQYGETLIVDWGLAKAQGRHDKQSSAMESVLRPKHASGSSATRLGSAVGTPAYMSPEQAAGRLDELGPATDIYSLGATLYSLLTGVPPYQDKDVSKLLERVKAGDLRRPRELVSTVPPPLEAICLVAMSREPEKRYRSAAALVGDLERFLADEPVSAYAEPFAARSWRWLRKHRTFAVATAATLAVLAVGFAVATAVVNHWRREAAELAVRERDARRQAVERLRDARSAVDVWLTGTSDLAGIAANEWPGGAGEHVRLRLLQQAATDYERFAKQDAEDFDLRLEQGRTYLRLGDVRRLLGQLDAAGAAYRQAERLLTELAAGEDNEFEANLELANARIRLGLWEAAKNEFTSAARNYSSAIEILQPLVASAPQDARRNDALATALLNRAVLQRDQGENDAARRSLEASLTHYHRASAASGGSSRLALAMATANILRMELARRSGQLEAAVGHAQRAIESLEAESAGGKWNAGAMKTRADARLHLASTLRPLGRYEEERRAYEDALSDLEKLCAALPEVPGYAWDRARTQLDYALLLLLLRDCPSAKKMLEAALPWLERVADAIADPQAALDLAVGRDALGEVLRELGDAQSARKLHSLAIESLTQLAGESPTKAEYRLRQALNRSYFGQAASATNSVVEATQAWTASERLLDELIQQANAGGASSAGDLAGYRSARGFVRTHRGYQLWRQADEAAAKVFSDALADFCFAAEVASPAPDHVHDLACFYVKCPIAALRDNASAVRLATTASSAVPANATFLGTLGAAQVRAESYAVGAETLRRALDARSPGDPRDWMFLAVAQARLNQPEQARQSWDKGLKRLGELCPANVELRALEKEFAPLFGDAP